MRTKLLKNTQFDVAKAFQELSGGEECVNAENIERFLKQQGLKVTP